jgi:glycosyltransferase involved in cell wall biosynthesis
MNGLSPGVRRFARVALKPILPVIRGLLGAPNAIATWRISGAFERARSGEPRVAYVMPDFPAPPPTRRDFALGGAAKMVYLAEAFPHCFPSCDVLFIVSSVQHPSVRTIARRAQARGIRVVLNQNGVYYRGWYGPGWEAQNRPLAAIHSLADYVVYQSDFCRRSAEAMLGSAQGSTSVLFNPVDLAEFVPANPSPDVTRLLTRAPTHGQRDRLVVCIRALAVVRRSVPNALLTIAGWNAELAADAALIAWVHRVLRDEGLPATALEVLPRFRRSEASRVLQRAHLLLHPVYNDASPGIVVESLACGVPVVFSASGGVPELVGSAGIGISAPEDFDHYHLPDPDDLAKAVVDTLNARDRLALIARARAESMFGLDAWLVAHRRIFETVAS